MKLSTFFLLLATSSVLLAADPVEFQVGAFTFERPEQWKWIMPTSAMRKAQLEVPGTNQEKADITFYHFGPGQAAESKPMSIAGSDNSKVDQPRVRKLPKAELASILFKPREPSRAECLGAAATS
jgi:hypothetical protein